MRATVPPNSQAELGRYYWVVLASLALVMGTTILVRDGIGLLAPFLQADLGISRTELGLYLTASSLGTIVSSVPLGFFADVVGTRRILTFGPLALGASFFLFGWIASWAQGLAIAFLGGLTYASVSPGTAKAIMDWFPLRVRATAMAVKQTGIPLGVAVAGLTLPALALTLTWRHAVAAASVAITASAALVFLTYRDPAASPPVALSTPGGWRALRDVLGSRDIVILTLAMASFVVVHYGFTTYWVLYLHQYQSLSEVAAGGFLALAHAASAASRIGWGIASDRLFGGSRRLPLVLIAMLTAGITGGLASLGPQALPWMLAAAAVLFGLVTMAWGSLANTLVTELAGRQRAGTAVGLGSTVSSVGIAFGPVLFGYIVDQTGSYQWGWLFLTICSLVALVLFLLIREEKRKA